VPMHGTKRERARESVQNVCDRFCARSPIKRVNSMTEEENVFIVDANFSTRSPSKKSLAELGDCAQPGASLTSANACAAMSALPTETDIAGAPVNVS
jgi:hypothetical protein